MIDLQILAKKLAENTARDESGCLLWTGYTQPNGYGFISVHGEKIAAHRGALMLTGVTVPDDMDVCHTCDVRNCVDPDHLYVGTRRQNMADCTARGRHNKPRGEAHWCAKLSAEQVIDVRRLREQGETVTSLAERFGVHHSTISRISRREWRKEVA